MKRKNKLEIEIRQEVFEVFNDWKKVEYFMKTKNLNFGNLSPNFLIKVGRGPKLLQMIKDMKAGNIA